MSSSIFIVGSTCSGKSHWSLQIADRCPAVIFNCDSVQLYKDLKIGSAQPSDDEMKRHPHYLFDFVTPPNEMTAGEYRRIFFHTLDQIKDHSPPMHLVVGGTGFYFQALEKGLFEIVKVDSRIKKEVEDQLKTPSGLESAYAELAEKDPEAIEKIHRADAYRIGRALEILRSSGRKVSELHREQKEKAPVYPEPLLKIGFYFEKEELRIRVKQRTEMMLKQGLLEETEAVIKKGFADWAPLQSVGYKEAVAYLNGEISYDEMKELIGVHTMQLAKRQRTWFKRDSNIHWFHGNSDLEPVMQLVNQHLSLA